MKYYLIILSSLLLFSCQEEITLDLPQAEEKLVVEGSIEPGFPPYVILSTNQSYFDPIDVETYNNIFVSNATEVKVWYIDEYQDTITKYLEKIEIDSFPPIYTDIDYINNLLNGSNSEYDFSKQGYTYYLEIKWNNKTITSQTTIPFSTSLDSVWVEKSERDEKEFKCDIKAIYSDPAEIQNNILVKSKRLQHFKKDSCNSVSKSDFLFLLVDAGSDVLFNGEQFETYFPKPSENGGFPNGTYNTSRYRNCNDGEDSIFLDHDVVLIKFCQIDEPSMKFWRGLTRQSGSNGNPFAEPLNLPSNINGGLGVWTGYGSTYYKVPIIKETVIFEEYIPENIFDIL